MDQMGKHCRSKWHSFFVIMFFFFQHFYFGSFIKTELVTVEQADIISTYDQLEKNPYLKVKWITYDTVYMKFQNAPPGSVKNKLWLRSQPEAMVAPLAGQSGERLWTGLNSNIVVAIGHWVTIHIIHAAMCPMAREFQDAYCVFRYPKQLVKRYVKGDEIPAASVYNDRMDPMIVKFMAKRVTASVESDIVRFLTSSFEAPYHVSTAVSKKNIIACREDRGLDAGHAVVLQKVMNDFHTLFAMWFGVTAFAFLLLMCEYGACMIRQKMSRRSRRVQPADLIAYVSTRPARMRRHTWTATLETLGATTTGDNSGDLTLTQQCLRGSKVGRTCNSAAAVL